MSNGTYQQIPYPKKQSNINPELRGVDALNRVLILNGTNISGLVPTIPNTASHLDGSWLSTDIYSGEIFINTADRTMFTRITEVDEQGNVVKDEIAAVGEIVPIPPDLMNHVFFHNGSRPMTGNMNMNKYNISNVESITKDGSIIYWGDHELTISTRSYELMIVEEITNPVTGMITREGGIIFGMPNYQFSIPMTPPNEGEYLRFKDMLDGKGARYVWANAEESGIYYINTFVDAAAGDTKEFKLPTLSANENFFADVTIVGSINKINPRFFSIKKQFSVYRDNAGYHEDVWASESEMTSYEAAEMSVVYNEQTNSIEIKHTASPAYEATYRLAVTTTTCQRN